LLFSLLLTNQTLHMAYHTFFLPPYLLNSFIVG
jgi:hypothetical protein